MQRLSLTTQQLAIIDDWRVNNNVQPTDVVIAGSNLKVDDHLQIDGSWYVVVLAGDGGGAVHSFIPEWGDLILNIDLKNYITDRAGPNGETMPIYDEQQMLAMAQAKENPNAAAKDERDRRRELSTALRDALHRLPDGEARRKARQAMRDAGVLDAKDDTP